MAEQEPDIGKEIGKMPVEPLLPIEKKLIFWSLGLGAVLLFVLIWATGALFFLNRRRSLIGRLDAV